MLMAFIPFIGIIIYLVKKAFKIADALAVDEKIGDIKSEANLVSEISDFEEQCPDKIEASKSNKLKDFI